MNKKKCVSGPDIEIVENDNERLFADPDLLLEHLNDLIIEYCNKWHFDINDIRPLQFNAVLDHLYLHFFKPNKYMYILDPLSIPNHSIANSITNKYNFDVVVYIYNIYKKLCNNYSMIISIDGFSTMSGIHEDSIYAWRDGLVTGATSAQVNFAKTIIDDKQKSLENMLMDKSINPIKPIAILNHRYGWNMPGVTKEVRESPALSTSQLPNLSLTDEQKPLLSDKSE